MKHRLSSACRIPAWVRRVCRVRDHVASVPRLQPAALQRTGRVTRLRCPVPAAIA